MDCPLIFANLADVIQVIIFLIIMGAGAFFQLLSAAAEKKKQEAAQKNTSPEDQAIQAIVETVEKQRPSRTTEAASRQQQRRPSKSSTALGSVAQPTAVFSTASPFPSSNSEQADSGLASEIHQLLHDPESMRQVIVLSEVLTRKKYDS